MSQTMTTGRPMATLTPTGPYYTADGPVGPTPSKRLLKLLRTCVLAQGRSSLPAAARAVGMTTGRAAYLIDSVKVYLDALPDGPQRERARQRYGL